MAKLGYSVGFNSSKIFRETISQIKWHSSYVKEGKGLEAALTYARYVMWSGLVELCDQHRSNDEFFPCDGRKLLKAAERLQRDVQDWYSGLRKEPEITFTDLGEINRKLDLLLQPGQTVFVPRVVDNDFQLRMF
jgi:hypothetical protein